MKHYKEMGIVNNSIHLLGIQTCFVKLANGFKAEGILNKYQRVCF